MYYLNQLKRKSLCALFTMCALDVGGCSWVGISSVEHWEGSRSTAAPSLISDVKSFKIEYMMFQSMRIIVKSKQNFSVISNSKIYCKVFIPAFENFSSLRLFLYSMLCFCCLFYFLFRFSFAIYRAELSPGDRCRLSYTLTHNIQAVFFSMFYKLDHNVIS